MRVIEALCGLRGCSVLRLELFQGQVITMLVSLISKAKCSIAERKRKAALSRIRKELSFWGVDTDGLTDEELEKGVVEFCRSLSKTGMTVEECAKALDAIAEVFRESSCLINLREHVDG